MNFFEFLFKNSHSLQQKGHKLHTKNETRKIKLYKNESVLKKLSKQITQRHKFTSFETLWFRDLLLQAKFVKAYKKVRHIFTPTMGDCYKRKILALKRDILAFERRDFNLAKIENSKVAKALLKDNIALNEVFELKEKNDENVIEAFFNRHNKDPLNAELFSKTLAVAKRLEVKVIFIAKRHSGAYYSAKIKTIFMLFNNKPKIVKAQTLLHELIHSVTIDVLNDLESVKTTSHFFKSQIKPLRKIVKIYSKLQNSVKTNIYGLISIEEFLAELSNPEFREFLQKNKALKIMLKSYFEFLKNMNDNLFYEIL